MAIKYDIQGLLIYMAMGAYLFAFVVNLLKAKKPAQLLFFVAFILSTICFVYRWIHVRHIPFQNLFEVFLALAVIVWPLSLFSRRSLNIESETFDMLLGAIVLLPAGFVFSSHPQNLPPALQCWLFIPHVAAYSLSYVIMAKAAVQAGLGLYYDRKSWALYERSSYEMVCLGFPLLTAGLLLGSWWGQLAWGDWWGWDPKELWSLASWLVYAGYLHFRYMFGKKYLRTNYAWILTGMAVIIITLLWVNLSKIFAGLHTYAT